MVLASVDAVVMLSDGRVVARLAARVHGERRPAGLRDRPSIDEWVQQGVGAEIAPRRDVDAVARHVCGSSASPRSAGGTRSETSARPARFGDPGAEMEELYEELAGA